MSPKQKILIDHYDDTYEFTIEDNKITRVIKFIGSSGMPRETSYDSVPPQVKQQLHDELE